MNYVSKIVGKKEALSLAQLCIHTSAFVEVTPLPDDQYEVRVKKDQERVLYERFLVIGQGKETRQEGGLVYALDMPSAVNAVRKSSGRACYVGTHNATCSLQVDEVEYVDYVGEDSDSGFIIRPDVVDGVVVGYLGEEWVNGDIVDTTNGAYPWIRRWISDNHAGHWRRRYSLNELIDIWNEVQGLPLVGNLLVEPFMFFPAGASVRDVLLLIMDANHLFITVDGVIGEEHWLRKTGK
ncbi:hypothetical protein RZ737_004813 [Escherichia coli]|nr:hypothetical protein [Escherichia coli]